MEAVWTMRHWTPEDRNSSLNSNWLCDHEQCTLENEVPKQWLSYKVTKPINNRPGKEFWSSGS